MTQTNTIRRMQIKDEEGGLVGIFVDVAKLVPRLKELLQLSAGLEVWTEGERYDYLAHKLNDLIEELQR